MSLGKQYLPRPYLILKKEIELENDLFCASSYDLSAPFGRKRAGAEKIVSIAMIPSVVEHL